MAEVADIRRAMADRLQTYLGPGVQVSPYANSNPMLPGLIILAAPADYDASFGDSGIADLEFLVRIVVANVDDIGAELNLDPYLARTGEKSIRQALSTDATGAKDKTLDGLVSDITVSGHEGEQVFTFPNRPAALGAEFRVEVKAA